MKMIKIETPNLSLSAKCRLLSISRSSMYYQPKPIPPADLKLLQLIDQHFLEDPNLGSRRMTMVLRRQGYVINRKKVQRLMRDLGIVAIYAKPNTSAPHPAHKTYPYLLRGLDINRANQVWCTDITYIPMQKGFLYLVAIMDWYSRKVLAWRLSNVMDTDFCVEALQEALELHGQPEIFNTDQGSQFTSEAFTSTLLNANIKISMDGRGRYLDNIFIERLWRSVKHECIYIHAPNTGSSLKHVLRQWFSYYNQRRLHQALHYKTPNEFYLASRNKNTNLINNQIIRPTKLAA